MIFISIIIPVFNRKGVIDRCLDSILVQSFADYEIIVVDDGSVDGTDKVCDDYARKYEKVKVIHQKNGGVSKARNTGMEIAKGQYVIFIDSDDCISQDYLKQIKVAYEKYGTEFLYCMPFKVHTTCGIQYYQYEKKGSYTIAEGNDLFKLIDRVLFNSVVNKIYELSFVKEHKIWFPESINLGEDLVFNLRYLDKMAEFKFIILNKNFYIVWYDDIEESMERGWRENYFEIQERLLREEIKYINKWNREGKIHFDGEKVYNRWCFNCIRESVVYYIAHIKNMNFKQIIGRIDKIKHSPEYLKCVQVYGKRKCRITCMIGDILYSKFKDKWFGKNKEEAYNEDFGCGGTFR